MSPDVHDIHWLNNVPLSDISYQNSYRRVTDFLDKFVSKDSSLREIQDRQQLPSIFPDSTDIYVSNLLMH